MKRWISLCIIAALILFFVFWFLRTALEPKDFTGEWFSADGADLYIFKDGIVECRHHYVQLSDTGIISGAYSFSKDTIAIFAIGVDGLENVKELHLLHDESGDMLCEMKDGSGRIYFYRNQASAVSPE